MKRKTTIKILALLFALFFTFATSAAEDIIETHEQGEKAFKTVRKMMAKLGIKVDRNILLRVAPKEHVQVHFISGGGIAISVGGYYQPHSPESIWMVSGQRRNKFIGDLAHEYTHAWQSTEAPLQDRAITEGFAMWCQYKILMELGEYGYAGRLVRLRHPDYGGGLRMFLYIEKTKGVDGVMKFARTARAVPEEYKKFVKPARRK